MTDTKAPQALSDSDLETATGGAGYLKLGDIEGESISKSRIVDSFETVGKRDIGTGGKPVATEEVTLGYTEVEWTY
ncbi:MAG: hypothetical protein AAFN27_08100 [Pseudomonadota bacterium]